MSRQAGTGVSPNTVSFNAAISAAEKALFVAMLVEMKDFKKQTHKNVKRKEVLQPAADLGISSQQALLVQMQSF